MDLSRRSEFTAVDEQGELWTLDFFQRRYVPARDLLWTLWRQNYSPGEEWDIDWDEAHRAWIEQNRADCASPLTGQMSA